MAGNIRFSAQDLAKIKSSVLSRYARVSAGEWAKLFRYPIGRQGMDGLGYGNQDTDHLPDDVAGTFCGVSHVFSQNPAPEGATVLDIGCGAGVDTIIAAGKAGPDGRAVGVDLTPGMIQQASVNARKAECNNASFAQACSQSLPFADESFHTVISNGVFNLVADKAKALEEVWRVMKPGGSLAIADQVLIDESPRDMDTMTRNWGR